MGRGTLGRGGLAFGVGLRHWRASHTLPDLHLPSRVREQLQSVQAQWTRVQEKSDQRRRQLLASLQLQVRGRPGRCTAAPTAVRHSAHFTAYKALTHPHVMALTFIVPLCDSS